MSSYVIIHDRVIILRILCEIDPITPSSLQYYIFATASSYRPQVTRATPGT